jgi:hypothetical protein
MTRYRICQGWLDKKYTVQRRPNLWPLWSNVLIQRFDTFEEAQSLLQSCESVDRIPLPSSKARSRNLVTYHIKRLTTWKLFLENSRHGGFANSVRLSELDQKLDRLYRIYRKLLMQSDLEVTKK